MIALHILELKNFMNQLLCKETFDNFLLREADITNYVTWSLDGSIQKNFYSSDELESRGLIGLSFLPFSTVRTQCFDLIKGKHTPSYFKFIFLLSPANLARTLEQTHSSFSPDDITGMFLNLKYQNGELHCTTGVSYRIFSPDKSLEHEWDALVKRFFSGHGILYEEL